MKNRSIDVFIIAKGEPAPFFESLLNEIETLNGKIRHAFPPKVIFASVPGRNVNKLRMSGNVAFLSTDLIDEPPALLSADETRDIVSIWNKLISVSREPGIKVPADNDLSWDAPGYLPPDPPPHIRKMMDKWEEDSDKQEDNH